MQLVALSALCLWGALFLCGSVSSHDAPLSATAELMKQAALSIDSGDLPCGKWDCDCTFNRQRGCCCAANQVFALENSTFHRMMNIWYQISVLEAGVKEVTENIQVSFAASMAPSEDCYGPFTTNISIPYSVVRLNQGYGYNPSLGVFTAPRGGVYVFTFTAYSNVGFNEAGQANRLYHKVQMMKNGQVVVSMWEDNREDMEDSGSQVVVLHMKRGCQVYVELMSGRNLCGNAQEFNFFSGYLLYPDLAE